MFKAKWLSLILILVLVASLAVVLFACGEEDEKEQTNQVIDNIPNDNTDTGSIDGKEGALDSIYYNIYFKDYDGTLLYQTSVLEGTTPEYAKSVPTRAKDANYKYIFRGWSPNIEKVTKEATYTAQYSKEELPYVISFDLNGGSSISEIKSFKTDEIQKDDFVFNITKPQYAFIGWSYNGTIIFNKDGVRVNDCTLTSNMTFKAEFEEQVTLTVYYTIYNPSNDQLLETFDTLPTNMGSVSKTRSYPWNTNVNLFANPNEGYTFVGWYYQENGTMYPLSSESNYNYMMWDDDFTVEARFEYTLYDLKVWANHPENGQVIIRNDTIYSDNSTKEKYFTEKVTIAANTKTDVRFLGWYDENNNLVTTNAVYSFDMLNRDYTLEAKWNHFVIFYDLDGGVNNANNPTEYYSGMNNIPLLNPAKEGYTFIGWYYNDGKITKINIQNICDMLLEARWTSYTVTTTSNISSAGSTNYSIATIVTVGNNVTITATTNTGYTFVGWFKGSEQVSTNLSYIFEMPAENVTYEARWTSYTITTTSNNSAAGSTNYPVATKVAVGDNVTITAITNPGYTFIGWHKGNEQVCVNLSYTFAMPAENEIYEARWCINSYTITINNRAVADGVDIYGTSVDNSYEYDSNITFFATNIPSGYVLQWERDDGVFYAGSSCTFNMPACNLLVNVSMLYCKSDNEIYFGSYPQTKVTDAIVITALNALAGALPTLSNSSSWTDYRYYIDGSIQSYMWYQDVAYQNNKYRGVYFTQYRPYYCSESSSATKSFQDDNAYQTSTVYWFKYEPIKWQVLTESNGRVLLVADLILDSQEYQARNVDTSKYSNSDYSISSIRSWLKHVFYNDAFSECEKAIIDITNVVNNANSTGYSSNNNACSNTSDKIFLLSYMEATNSDYGFDESTSRQAKGSDYAKVQGVWASTDSNSASWLLRSPVDVGSYYVRIVEPSGEIMSSMVFATENGIRPACCIQLIE